MSEATRIRKNSLFSFLSISLRLIANVIVFWIIGSHYGPKVFGQFTTAQTIAAIFIVFADFGLDVLLTTEVAQNRKDAAKKFQRLYSIKIVFCIIALILMWLLSLLSNFGATSKLLIFVFSFYVVFTTLTNFLNALYKGFEKLHFETGVAIVVNLLLLVLVFILLFLKVKVIFIAAAFVVARFIGFIVAIFSSYKVLPEIKYQLIFKDWKEIKDQVLVFGLHLIFGSLFFQLDTILLAIWKGDADVGIYQAAFKLIALPLVIPDILINTLLPVLSRFNYENKKMWIKLGGLLNKTLTLISLPISIILFNYADFMINFIYPAGKFSASIPILRIFAVILFIRFGVESYALMLTTSHRQKIRMIVVVAGTIINFSLNYIMIPLYGPMGAAIISLITNLLVGLGYILTTTPFFLEWTVNLKYALSIVFAIGLSFVIWNIRGFSPYIIIPIILLICLYIFFKFSFSKEEKELIFRRGNELTNLLSKMKIRA